VLNLFLVLDTDFNPFNDYIVASASEDANIMVWSIPEDGLTKNVTDPLVTLNNHTKKVGQILFHPTADNVLASSSADLTLRVSTFVIFSFFFHMFTFGTALGY
jgi:coronin-1B/1C/6